MRDAYMQRNDVPTYEEGSDQLEEAMDSEQTYPIRRVSEMLGIPIPTIRSWERRYGFPQPARTHGRHRRYSQTTIDQLRALRNEVARGRAVGEAVRVLRTALARTDPAATSAANDLVKLAMELDADGLRAAIASAGDRHGLERAVQDVLFVALRRTGDRREAGDCGPGSEELLAGEIGAWLRAFSERLHPTGATIVLACGPEDEHSLGLEAFGCILADRGWTVANLGARTSVAALVGASVGLGARGAVVVSHQSVTRRPAVAAIRRVAGVDGLEVFYGGGAFVSKGSRRSLPGSYLGEDLPAAADVISVVLLGEHAHT
jgi:DNA-binding transcriptional MerR regulator/methylmalonyl-CoA mutase cobalamin-binding subunit